MSAWNRILQATHSALIDELNARFPDDKLELGLPKRIDGYGSVGAATQALFREVRSEAEGDGFAAIAGAANQPAKELADVFAKALARAEKEFAIRGIAASFGETFAEPPKARMTIWLPIAIRRPKETQSFDLALGIGVSSG